MEKQKTKIDVIEVMCGAIFILFFYFRAQNRTPTPISCIFLKINWLFIENVHFKIPNSFSASDAFLKSFVLNRCVIYDFYLYLYYYSLFVYYSLPFFSISTFFILIYLLSRIEYKLNKILIIIYDREILCFENANQKRSKRIIFVELELPEKVANVTRNVNSRTLRANVKHRVHENIIGMTLM